MPKPIVEGLFHEGETVMVAGRPKMGKSLLMLQLAVCASRGERFLNLEVPRPQRVLYLDLENGQAAVLKRIRKMFPEHRQDDNVFVYCPETLADESITLRSDEGLRNLEDMLDEVKPDILVIDPFRLFCGGDELKGKDMLEAIRKISGLRRKHPKLLIVVVHHLRKRQGQAKEQVKLREDPSDWVQEASGSYVLVGHFDGTFGLDRERKGDEDELIVFGGSARHVSPDTLLLTLDEESLTFSIARGEELLIKLLTRVEREYWDLAKTRKEFTFNSLVDARAGENRGAVARMLRKAKNQGLIEKLSDNKGYRLVDQARTEKAA